MGNYFSIQNKLSNNVIDIQQSSKISGAGLDAYTPRNSDNDNQLWEFVPDPAGSGYYFIKSKLSGNVIDIMHSSVQPGMNLDAFSQKTTGSDNQLWEFNPDPAGSGYFFIRSKLSGNVIDVQQASTKPGALLDAYTQRTSDYDNQLWKVVGGNFPAPAWTGISWGPLGTGPSPNSSTIFTDGNECAYQMSASIRQDGTCTFSGYYQNRGDVWWGTAPPQAFVVAFLVYDTSGKIYSLSYSGACPSAPQNGSLVTWNFTGKSPLIAENWYPIAAKNSGRGYVWNTYDESVGSVVSGWVTEAAKDLGEAASEFLQGLSESDQSEEDGDGDDIAVSKVVLLPLPAGAPTGDAATGHQADSTFAGKGSTELAIQGSALSSAAALHVLPS
jgi:hypothetical protein